jgi:hypothetical protein
MGTVGLLYVGAVLFINGLMLMGYVDGRAAAIFNLFVGVLQVVTPTYLIFTSGGDNLTILGASGLYLFGFTYLYVGIGILMGLDSTGVGYFSLFVAVAAVVFSVYNFDSDLLNSKAFGVIWLHWAFLWGLFYLLLGQKRDGLGRYTGMVTAIQGWVTAAIPALLLLGGYWQEWDDQTIAIVLAIFGVVVFAALWVVAKPSLARQAPAHVAA